MRRSTTTLAEAMAAGKLVVFDPNIRPRLWADRDVMLETISNGARAATLVMPSFDDEASHFGDDSVEDLYTWVDTLEEHTGLHYSLVSNFPRKVFSRMDDGDVTLKDGDLCPQATLMYRLDD